MNNAVPHGWRLMEAESIFDRLRVPNVYDRNNVFSTGMYQVIDQSEKGCIGYINQLPEFQCDTDSPLITFANHTCAVRKMTAPFSVIQNVFPLKAKQPNSTRFLYHLLKEAIPQVGYKGHYPQLRETQFAVPTVPEQQKIAAILTAVDDVIESTQAQINKLKDLKTGMMQELLTKGIGHTEFKDSSVGRIPAEWKISKLEDVFSIKHGYPFEGEYFTSIPHSHVLLTPGNFHKDGHLYFGEKTKYFAGPILEDYVLNNGDLLVVMTDLTKEMAILGNAIELYSPISVLHNQRIGKVSILDQGKILSNFACLALNSEIVKRHVRDTATGTTVRHTSPSRILEPSIAIPSLEEQKQIVDAIESVNIRLNLAKEKLSKSNELKKALMQDLLTGKVRVQVN